MGGGSQAVFTSVLKSWEWAPSSLRDPNHFPVLSSFSCIVSATPSFLAFSSSPLCVHPEFSESGHR